MRPYALLLLALVLFGTLTLGADVASAGGDEDAPAPAAPDQDEPDEPDGDILPGLVIPEDLVDLVEEMASFGEDVDDLQEPVDEFEQFDQCMFLIGITQFGGADAEPGFRFSSAASSTPRPAFAMDIRGLEAAQFNFLAFPGEEPPQIECNEDAGGENTDE
jgi:hypothetical protein